MNQIPKIQIASFEGVHKRRLRLMNVFRQEINFEDISSGMYV